VSALVAGVMVALHSKGIFPVKVGQYDHKPAAKAES